MFFLCVTDQSMISIPLIWVLLGLALSNHESYIDFQEWDQKYMFIYTLFFAVIIPILLLAVTKIKYLSKGR